ncbi:MAG TPA: trehalose utilization protein ThuA [Candidatus Latescibacteria bacterium]|nr:trehalose utilization protein ThuA [Gemmatimonadota bacterium]HCR18854.1 trehalose utilization protein ThuA [Candidatus Latescibacterota bacterium]|tara:strand:- start:3416 stop:4150 length:735 start_codon:yes stop_codon:yes gene_type:complete
MAKIRVTVWNEYRHEKEKPEIGKVYPEGIHGAIANHLSQVEALEVRTATLDEPGQGLPDKVLDATDVLTWWGHGAHQEVEDNLVDRLQSRILDGMGLICLHSAHFSKIFKRMMGTTCNLKWREMGEKERIWVIEPGHPIADGVGEYIEIPKAEMYGERFDIPDPDTLVFVSWFPGGEIFRSGCCYHRGRGKIFYFRPGHETYPIFRNPEVLKVLTNAVNWAAPVQGPAPTFGNYKPLENVLIAD